MRQETRTAVYDAALHIEAFHFQGLVRPFPSHFHAHYVIGLVEAGERELRCQNQTHLLRPGDILLLHPGDSHACTQSDGGTLDYRGLNLTGEVMQHLTGELTGRRELPGFSQNVISDGACACHLRRLHTLIQSRSREFEKEEHLLLLLSLLLRRYGQPFARSLPPCAGEIEAACAFMEQHYARHINLDQICRRAGLSKSALLRAFPKAKGVTPYRYLENIRISQAKKLLEQGVTPVEAALRTGFSDQSHFTNYFSRFIGLSPGAYRDIFTDRGASPPNHKEEKSDGPKQ